MAVDARRPWAEQKREERVDHPDVFETYEAFKRAVRTGRRVSPERPMIPVERPEDVPTFASEAEEHEYWGVHEMGDGFFDGAGADADTGLPAPRARDGQSKRLDKVIPIRLPDDKWEALRAQAVELGLTPSTLARMWIFERLRAAPRGTAARSLTANVGGNVEG